MKRLAKVFLALVLVTGLLCGCSGIIADQTVTRDELTITLPGTFLDLSNGEYAEGLELLYGFGDTAVTAIKEDKALFAELIPDMGAQQYAELFVESNGLSDTVEVVDNIPSFEYHRTVEGTSITYLCGVFESETAFWVVQVYCPTADYAGYQEDLWSYITSVTIA